MCVWDVREEVGIRTSGDSKDTKTLTDAGCNCGHPNGPVRTERMESSIAIAISGPPGIRDMYSMQVVTAIDL